jgi:hypothetical protein
MEITSFGLGLSGMESVAVRNISYSMIFHRVISTGMGAFFPKNLLKNKSWYSMELLQYSPLCTPGREI